MSAGDPIGTDWRKPRWPWLLVVFVVLPVAALFGNSAIFNLFGNGEYLPQDSTGSHVLHWWESWGRPLTVGIAAWLILTIGRFSQRSRLMLALGSVAAAYLWLIVAIAIVLILNPGALS